MTEGLHGCSLFNHNVSHHLIDAVKKKEKLDKIENDIEAVISAGVHLGFTAAPTDAAADELHHRLRHYYSWKRSSSQLAAASTLSPSICVVASIHGCFISISSGGCGKTRQEIGIDLPVFHPVLDRRTSVPQTYSSSGGIQDLGGGHGWGVASGRRAAPGRVREGYPPPAPLNNMLAPSLVPRPCFYMLRWRKTGFSLPATYKKQGLGTRLVGTPPN